MAVWLRFKGYNGFAKYWNEWAEEELIHASWASEYLLDLDVKPEIRPLKEVDNEFESVKDIVEKTLKAEIEITDQCNELGKRADEKPDYMLKNLASIYLDEQQEEINKVTNLLSLLEAFGDSKVALLELDKKMFKGIL
jgi:ferritin